MWCRVGHRGLSRVFDIMPRAIQHANVDMDGLGDSLSLAQTAGANATELDDVFSALRLDSHGQKPAILDNEPVPTTQRPVAGNDATRTPEVDGAVQLMEYDVRVANGVSVTWQLAIVRAKLFVAIPDGSLDGAKEAFVSLLELAETKLRATHVVVLFRRERADRQSLIHAFMYMGFSPLPPNSPLTGGRYNPDFTYLGYKIE